jgi:hypothetical protein
MAKQWEKLWQRVQVLPPGLRLAAMVIVLVGGQYLWVCIDRPAHRQELASAFGSVGIFYGAPQPDHSGNRFTFVETSDHGYGLFFADASTGHKTLMREETDSDSRLVSVRCALRAWPWSPDDSAFIYSEAGQISICDPATGKTITELNILTTVTALTWLAPGVFVCVDAYGNLHQFEKQTDGTWGRKGSSDTGGVPSASSEGGQDESAAAAFDGSVHTKWISSDGSSSGWLQYQFGGGAAWAVSQYALTSANDSPSRDPMDWQFQASNDGDTWINLDVQSGETFTSRLQTKSYSFANTTPYRLYRLNITSSRQNNGSGLQLSEFYLGTAGVSNNVSLARNPFSGAFSLTTLSSDTIGWVQDNRIWSMNLASNTPSLLLDMQTVASTNTILRSFSYSKEAGQFLLSCTQDGKDSLWHFDPNSSSSGLHQITTTDNVRNGFWLNVTNHDGWVAQEDNDLLVCQNSASEPVKLLPRANINAFTVTPDGQRLLILGTVGKEPAAGIWQYDFASAKLQCVMPYGDHPSPYASHINPDGGFVILPSGENMHYDIFQPANFNRHRKYPLIIGDTYFGNVVNGAHGRLWVPGMAACDAYVVIVNRRDWNNGIEQWGEDVMAVYQQLSQTPNVDTHRVFLFGVSAETQYLSEFVAKYPGLWQGIIFLNPSGLPDFSKSPLFQQRPKILISAGSNEHEDDRFKQYQSEALKSGVLVEYFISPGEGHHFVGNAAQLERTKAMMHFIFEE